MQKYLFYAFPRTVLRMREYLDTQYDHVTDSLHSFSS